MFQAVFKYFRTPTNNNNNMVMAWKSKVLSNESIKFTDTLDNSLKPRLYYFINPKFWVEFDTKL